MNQSVSIPAAANAQDGGRSARSGGAQGSEQGGSRFEAMLRGQIDNRAADTQAESEPRPPAGKETRAADQGPSAADGPRAPGDADEAGGDVPAGSAALQADVATPLPLDLDGLFLDPQATLAGDVPSADAMAARGHLVPLLPGDVAAQHADAGPALAPGTLGIDGLAVPVAAPATGATPLTGAAGQAAAAELGVPAQQLRARSAARAASSGQPGLTSAGDAAAAGQGAAVIAGSAGADVEIEFQQALDMVARGGERGGADLAAQSRAAATLTGLGAVPGATGGETAAGAVPRHAMVLDHALGTPGWDAALGARMAWSVNNGVQAASLALNPRDLGPVNVQLSVHEDEVSLTFVSQHAAVREAIESALPRLRELLAGGGFDLGGVQISADSGQAGAGGDASGGEAGGESAARSDGTEHDGAAGGHASVRIADGLIDTFA